MAASYERCGMLVGNKLKHGRFMDVFASALHFLNEFEVANITLTIIE